MPDGIKRGYISNVYMMMMIRFNYYKNVKIVRYT